MENQVITGASFHRGKSKQDYCTPFDFRGAVIKKYGKPAFDLAASADNYFSPSEGDYFGAGIDSLEQRWDEVSGILWLNPPFNYIEPWARKCSEESKLGAEILFLVPASVGSNWWFNYVHNQCEVNFCNPRICFDGVAPFPKDIALCHYKKETKGNRFGLCGYSCWRWK